MKHITLLFCGLIIFLLTGCATPPPQISISMRTGAILTDEKGPITGQYAQDPETDFPYIFRYITGYSYTYTYPDLKLRIAVQWGIEPYVYGPPSTPIFRRYNNIISPSRDKDIGEYIQVLQKKPGIDLYKQVADNHLGPGCSISMLSGENYDFINNKDITLLGVEDDTYDNTGIVDTEFPQNHYLIFFVSNPENPSLYYKISYFPDCAPGPCSIFGKIDFLQ